jgi:hypothetical protein
MFAIIFGLSITEGSGGSETLREMHVSLSIHKYLANIATYDPKRN